MLQGAITHAVTSEQGLITEAGYKEQAESYRNMSSAAQVAIDAENQAADRAPLLAGIHVAAAIASIFTGGFPDLGGGGDGFEAQAPSDPGNPLRINRYAGAEPASAGPLPIGSLY